MRLLGEVCPKTLEGTIVGKPTAAAAPSDVFKKFLRDERRGFVRLFISLSPSSLTSS